MILPCLSLLSLYDRGQRIRQMSLANLVAFILPFKRARQNLIMGQIPDNYRGRSSSRPALGDAPNEKKSCHLDESPIYILKVSCRTCQKLKETLNIVNYTIFQVASVGNAEKVNKMLLENPKLINIFDNKGWGCVHHAASKGRLNVIDVLLANNAGVHSSSRY